MRINPFVPLCVSLSFVASSVAAQTDLERAAARDAANSGRAAYETGKYAQAIDSLTRAEQLVHAPTHLLFLARAQAKLGRLVAARESYLKITRETLPIGAPKAFVDAQASATDERQALEARLPSITVSVLGAGASGARVTMDGTTLPPAMIGIPLPVDPGQHQFQARAATGASAAVTITVAEGSKGTATLALAPIQTASQGPERHVAVPPGLPQQGLGAGDSTDQRSVLGTASYLSLGVGVLGLGFGAYSLIRSGNTRSEADDLLDACNAAGSTGRCVDPAKQREITAKDGDADGQRNLGAASLIVGGIGTAAGVTLLVLSAKRGPSSVSERRWVPVFGLRSLGLMGTF